VVAQGEAKPWQKTGAVYSIYPSGATKPSPPHEKNTPLSRQSTIRTKEAHCLFHFDCTKIKQLPGSYDKHKNIIKNQ
jgi:hypothetical protein